MIGQSISHYRILGKLGEGGMGVVYKAEDIRLQRTVALKFLPRGLDSHEPERARFLQEARAASALNHPNVCTIYDIGESEGQRFIVMEYVEGVTLREKIAGGGFQTAAAVAYAIQIGEALEEAHGKGIVHRDIKTENVMVTPKNQVKVMDFGLAKLRGSLKLTRTSSTVGTLAYMAPEQIQGGQVDARNDIFSFGVVLYEMLTGHLPFRGEHDAAMMYSILNEEPASLHKYLPDAPSELLHTVTRALEKDPEERYQTVHDMLIDLRRVRKGTSRVSRSPLPPASEPEAREATHAQGRTGGAGILLKRWKALGWIGLVGSAVVVVSLVFFFLVLRQPARLNVNPTFRTLEISLSQVTTACLSRDGSWAAFGAWDAGNKWSVYFMNVVKGKPRRLTSESFRDVSFAEISPDGGEVLYDRLSPEGTRGIYIVSSNGGSSRKITEPGGYARWRPDGERIGYIQAGWIYGGYPSTTGRREFWTVRPDGNDNHLVFADSLGYLWGSSACFDWSPDGTSIVWLRSFPGYGELFIRDLGSGQEHQLTTHRKEISEVTWASNGQVFFSSNMGGNTNIWMIPAGGGDAVQVTKGSGPDIGVRVSADARRLLFTERRSISNVWLAGVDGGNVKQVTFENLDMSNPFLSPDGDRISYHASSPDPLRAGSQIFVIDSNGSNLTQQTAGDALFYNATWSPDGKYITYGSHYAHEPWDSSRVYIIETTRPEASRLVGKGHHADWLDPERFVIIHPGPTIYSTLCSVHGREPIAETPDSTWEFPLRGGNHVLRGDARRGREGWWLHTPGETSQAADRLMLASEYLYCAWPSTSLRSLLYRQANGELWRISLPDGRRDRLPDTFKGYNPWCGFTLKPSYDDRQVVCLKGRLESRLVLIDNVFE